MGLSSNGNTKCHKETVRSREVIFLGVGDFSIQWHMASDLKTLKCIYNISKGANSKFPCLYCMHPAHHLDKGCQLQKPSRALEDPYFRPILNIELIHVHVYTLHALCRIVKKLVYLYIQFAWKLRPKSKSDASIRRIELLEMGLHGGKVKIIACPKISTTSHEVPIKPSLGGVKARRFLSYNGSNARINKDGNPSTIKYNLWKKMHNAVKDHANKGEQETIKQKSGYTWTRYFDHLI